MFHHQSWDSVIVLCIRILSLSDDESAYNGHGLTRLKSTLKTFYDKLTGILTVSVILELWFTFYVCPNDF